MALTPRGWGFAAAGLPGAGFRIPGLEAALDFLRRDFFEKGHQRPAEAEGVRDHGAAFAPGVGGGSAEDRCARFDGPSGSGVAIDNEEVEAQRAATDAFRAQRAPGGCFVAEHDDGVADLKFAVHDGAVLTGHAVALDGAEGGLVEIHRGRGVGEIEGWSELVKAARDGGEGHA